jgi:hypothetical protein
VKLYNCLTIGLAILLNGDLKTTAYRHLQSIFSNSLKIFTALPALIIFAALFK